MPALTLLSIATPQQVEQLRAIRNECRQFMTRDTSFVSPGQQALWFGALDRTRSFPYLLLPEDKQENVQPLGYGLIRLEKNTSLISGGLSEKFRGQGMGQRLFALLIDKARELGSAAIELEVLQDNTRARRVYDKLGFKAVSSSKGILCMRLM